MLRLRLVSSTNVSGQTVFIRSSLVTTSLLWRTRTTSTWNVLGVSATGTPLRIQDTFIGIDAKKGRTRTAPSCSGLVVDPTEHPFSRKDTSRNCEEV